MHRVGSCLDQFLGRKKLWVITIKEPGMRGCSVGEEWSHSRNKTNRSPSPWWYKGSEHFLLRDKIALWSVTCAGFFHFPDNIPIISEPACSAPWVPRVVQHALILGRHILSEFLSKLLVRQIWGNFNNQLWSDFTSIFNWCKNRHGAVKRGNDLIQEVQLGFLWGGYIASG